MASNNELSRSLSNRQVQLISIGGAIGTGLFLGSGKSIHQAGPSVLLTYIITGIIVFFIMRALGELLLSNLDSHSFVEFIYQYFGEKIAFIAGWTYWFCWVCVAVVDLVAVGLYTQLWFPTLPVWVIPLISLGILLILNLMSVKLFGEIEFWLSIIKVVAIMALIIGGIVLIILNVQNFAKTGQGPSFTYLWSEGGFFPNGTFAFLAAFQMAVLSFNGIEIVGLTAGETKDPESNIPKAINNIPLRVLLFYVGSLLVIMSMAPWTEFNADSSPFVKVFQLAGIATAASIINFVVLSSAFSAANSAIFSTSRMLFALGKADDAPKKLAEVSSHKVPQNALFFSGAVILMFFGMYFFIENPSEIFDIVATAASVCFLVVWVLIVAAHSKYKKSIKGTPQEKTSKFKMPWYPFSTYLVYGFMVFVFIILALEKSTQLAMVMGLIWIIAMYIISTIKFSKKAK